MKTSTVTTLVNIITIVIYFFIVLAILLGAYYFAEGHYVASLICLGGSIYNILRMIADEFSGKYVLPGKIIGCTVMCKHTGALAICDEELYYNKNWEFFF